MSAPLPPQARTWFVAAAIAVAVTFCYWDVRTFEFVNFDDTEYLTLNPHAMQELSVQSIGWAFTTLYMANWHPLTWVSYLADYKVYGPNPGGYHVSNVVFHILNSILLFLLLHRMSGRFWLAGLIGLLFAIHPMHVESVAWISERKDVLSTFFLILTMFAYYEYGRRSGYGWYTIALIFFVAGLMAKPMLVTLPFILLLLDYWPLQRLQLRSDRWYAYPVAYFSRTNAKLWVEKIPFFLTSAGASFVTIIAQEGAGAMGGSAKLSLLARTLNAIQSYGMYVYKTFIPVDLAVFYPYPKTLSILSATLVAAALIAVTVYALSTYKKRPYFITGWLVFIGTLVPVIGLVQVGAQAMADRYIYIPHIGLFLALVFLVGDVAGRFKKSIPVFAFTAVGLAVVFSMLTVRQVATWKNNETLYTHAIGVTAPNRLAHHNLSAHFIGAGQFKLALRHAKTAIAIEPKSATSHHNVGLAFERLGKFDSALVYYKRTLDLDPAHSITYNRIGVAYTELGLHDEARPWYAKALEADPGSAINNNNMGAHFFRMGMPDRAMDYFRRAIELDPYFNLPYNNVAMFMLGSEKYEEAERFLDRGLELDPSNHVANKYKGDMFVLRQQYDSALTYFSRALAAQPMNRDIHTRIMSILQREDMDSATHLH